MIADNNQPIIGD